jgi:hypothetical protein
MYAYARKSVSGNLAILNGSPVVGRPWRAGGCRRRQPHPEPTVTLRSANCNVPGRYASGSADDNALDRDHGAGRVRDANGDLSAADALTKRGAVRVTTRTKPSEALAWWPPLACFLDEVDEADEGSVVADPGREELAWSVG